MKWLDKILKRREKWPLDGVTPHGISYNPKPLTENGRWIETEDGWKWIEHYVIETKVYIDGKQIPGLQSIEVSKRYGSIKFTTFYPEITLKVKELLGKKHLLKVATKSKSDEINLFEGEVEFDDFLEFKCSVDDIVLECKAGFVKVRNEKEE